MSRTPGFLAVICAVLCGALPTRAAQDVALERGAAITDPATLRELDNGKFRLDRMLLPERSADLWLANSALFALPSMAPVQRAIDGEFDRYIARHRAGLPKETIGVGAGFDFQLFDRALLYSQETRFALAGIVNRMDRTYAAEASCGEIRLIYRLTRTSLSRSVDPFCGHRDPLNVQFRHAAHAPVSIPATIADGGTRRARPSKQSPETRSASSGTIRTRIAPT